MAYTVLTSLHMKHFRTFIFTTTLQDRKTHYSHFTHRQLKHNKIKQHVMLQKIVELKYCLLNRTLELTSYKPDCFVF